MHSLATILIQLYVNNSNTKLTECCGMHSHFNKRESLTLNMLRKASISVENMNPQFQRSRNIITAMCKGHLPVPLFTVYRNNSWRVFKVYFKWQEF